MSRAAIFENVVSKFFGTCKVDDSVVVGSRDWGGFNWSDKFPLKLAVGSDAKEVACDEVADFAGAGKDGAVVPTSASWEEGVEVVATIEFVRLPVREIGFPEVTVDLVLRVVVDRTAAEETMRVFSSREAEVVVIGVTSKLTITAGIADPIVTADEVLATGTGNAVVDAIYVEEDMGRAAFLIVVAEFIEKVVNV